MSRMSVMVGIIVCFCMGQTTVYKYTTEQRASYASFTAYLTAIGTDQKSIDIGSSIAIISTTTVPSNVEIRNFNNGAKFTGSGTLTIGRMSYQGTNQIFDTSLTIRFLPGAVKNIRPEWWGISPKLLRTSSVLQKMINSMPTGVITGFPLWNASISCTTGVIGSSIPTYWIPDRTSKWCDSQRVIFSSGAIKKSRVFSDASGHSFSDTTIPPTTDNCQFGWSSIVTVDSTQKWKNGVFDIPSTSIHASKWVVATVESKMVSGDVPTITICGKYDTTLVLATGLQNSDTLWRTVGIIGSTGSFTGPVAIMVGGNLSAGDAGIIKIGAFHVIEFSTKTDAEMYLLSGKFSYNDKEDFLFGRNTVKAAPPYVTYYGIDSIPKATQIRYDSTAKGTNFPGVISEYDSTNNDGVAFYGKSGHQNDVNKDSGAVCITSTVEGSAEPARTSYLWVSGNESDWLGNYYLQSGDSGQGCLISRMKIGLYFTFYRAHSLNYPSLQFSTGDVLYGGFRDSWATTIHGGLAGDTANLRVYGGKGYVSGTYASVELGSGVSNRISITSDSLMLPSTTFLDGSPMGSAATLNIHRRTDTLVVKFSATDSLCFKAITP